MAHYALAVDIGGTFTDAVLRSADRQDLGRQDPDDAGKPRRRLLPGSGRCPAQGGHRVRRRHRRGRACDDRGHQRGDRAQGAAHRAAGDRRLPRHPDDPRRASLRDVRSADRISAAPGPARADFRGLRESHRDRRGGGAPRCRASAGDRRGARAQGRGRGRGLVPQCLSQSGKRAGDARDHPRPRARHARFDLVGRGAADPRVSAYVHGRDERLYDADHRAVSRGAAARPEGTRLSQRSADHAEQWRRHRDRRRQPVSGAHGGVGAGGGRAGGCVLRRGARARPAPLVRHGRHHRQGLHHRGPCAAGGRQFRGRPHLSFQGRQRPAGSHPVRRHDRDRRRRRQHRGGQRSRPAQGRPAQRWLGARPGRLRPRRRQTDGDRRGSRARLPRCRQFPRRRHEARSRGGRAAAREPRRGARHLDPGRGRRNLSCRGRSR